MPRLHAVLILSTAANAPGGHFLGVPHHLASTFEDGFFKKKKLSTALSSFHNPVVHDHFTTDVFSFTLSAEVCFVRAEYGLRVAFHTESKTGGIKTVNKGHGQHLGRGEQHGHTNVQDPGINVGNSSETHQQFDTIYSNVTGYQYRSAMSRHLGRTTSH